MTHAGFWVDGAVRKPEQRHLDSGGCVAVNWKGKNPDFDICSEWFERWDSVYWLDTTPRESLTPEELFSVLKVLWPRCDRVLNPTGATVGWQIEFDDTNEHTNIDWGNLTQYPPPIEPQWIRITRENVGQYLFRDCRCKDVEFESWEAGCVVGWDLEDECCLVDGSTVERVMKYDFVEVQA